MSDTPSNPSTGTQTSAHAPVSATGAATSAPAPAHAQISQDVWDRAVGTWLDDHVRSSPIAQAPAAWQHLNDVLPRLREILARG